MIFTGFEEKNEEEADLQIHGECKPSDNCEG